MQFSRHDKTKTSFCVKLTPLQREDARCHGLAPDMVILACNVCGYISKPTKNESHNINQANFTARKAHAPQQGIAGSEHAGRPDANPNGASIAAYPRHVDADRQGSCATHLNVATADLAAQARTCQSSALQHTVNVERTVGQKRDRRDTKEVVTNKRREYYPDGTLKSEIEESKETTDQGETVSTETKELRSQVLQLKQERAIYEMKVEQTFKDRVNRAVASELTSRLKAEEAQNARRVEDTMARQVLADRAKDAKPLDTFMLAKVVQKQRALIAYLVDEAAAKTWLAEHATDFKVGSIPQLDHMAADLLAIEDDAFADQLPLLHTLGFSKAQLTALGIWPKAGPVFEESVEEEFEPEPGPMAPPRHPSPIDHLPKEAWTTEVVDNCLAVTEWGFRRPLNPEDEPRSRCDPPHLLEILDQFIRTRIYTDAPEPIIRNRKILAVTCRFQHPCGDAVNVQVDLHRLRAGENHAHYQEQIRRFYAKQRPLPTC